MIVKELSRVLVGCVKQNKIIYSKPRDGVIRAFLDEMSLNSTK